MPTLNEVEILQEMVEIYRKYFEVVVEMGTISMSPVDENRLKELENELTKLRA